MENHKVERLNHLIRHARATWLAALAFFAYCGVTLFSVKDIDFFSLERSIQLPILNIDIPTISFFYAAPALAAGLYIHLHLYLLKVWRQAGKVFEESTSTPDAIFPWLLTDWALRRRSGDKPPLPFITGPLAFLFGFVFGPLVLAGFWWRSAVLHAPWLTMPLLVLLVLAALAGLYSWLEMQRIGNSGRGGSQHSEGKGVDARDGHGHDDLGAEKGHSGNCRIGGGWLDTAIQTLALVMLPPLGLISWDMAGGGVFRPVSFMVKADLSGGHLTSKPDDWLDLDIWTKEFEAEWRRREVSRGIAVPAGPLSGKWKEEFEAEAKSRRANYLDSLPKPDLGGMDLRGANMRNTFAPGINLQGARLAGANLGGAKLRRAILLGTGLEGTYLVGARLEMADIRHARLAGADLGGARLAGADLGGASLAGVILTVARLDGANLRHARLEGANLKEADLSLAKNIRWESLKHAMGGGISLRTTIPEDAPRDAFIPDCWQEWPQLPPGVARPEWWNWYGDDLLCQPGQEPKNAATRPSQVSASDY